MTALNKQALRERYSPQPVPKCHICGAEMTVQRMSASRITYGCTGATYDNTGGHYAEGRSIADDHYAQSRVTVVGVSDPEVLALLDELEKEKGYASTYEAEKWHYHGLAESEGERADRAEKALEAAEKLIDILRQDKDKVIDTSKERIAEQREYYEGVIADGSKRIAELEASHSKLRDTIAAIHNTIRMDGGYTPLAAILNAAKRAYDESAIAVGIGVKGE